MQKEKINTSKSRATITSIFKRKKRCRQSERLFTYEQMEEFASLITEQARDQTRAEMKGVTIDLLKSCGVKVPSDVEVDMNLPTSPLHNLSSCQSIDFDQIDPDPITNGSKDELPCDLMVIGDNFGYRNVATRILCQSEPGELVHDVPLLHVKVTIVHVLGGEADTPLPLPFFGHDVLGDQIEGSRSSMVTHYLTHSISKKNKKQFIIAPFHQQYHWMLVLVFLQKGEAFLFASAGGGIGRVQVKGHISMGYGTWQVNNKGSRKNLSWKEVSCSRQPEKVECGYYVMKYMYQIVLLGLLSVGNLDKLFSLDPLSQ